MKNEKDYFCPENYLDKMTNSVQKTFIIVDIALLNDFFLDKIIVNFVQIRRCLSRLLSRKNVNFVQKKYSGQLIWTTTFLEISN
ncbi:hypothetical protein M0R01_00510 [bacterium]|nr:hypothetical protein [bacterium]